MEQWGLQNLAQILSPVVGWGLMSVAGWGIWQWLASIINLSNVVKRYRQQSVTQVAFLIISVCGTALGGILGAALLTPWLPSYTANRIVSALAVGAGAALVQRVVKR